MWLWVIDALRCWSRILEFLLAHVTFPVAAIVIVGVIVLFFVRRARPYALAWFPIVAFFWLGISFLHEEWVLNYFTTLVTPLQARLLEAYFPMLVLIGIAQFVILYVCVAYSIDIGDLTAKTPRAKRLRRLAQCLCWVCAVAALLLLAHIWEHPSKAPNIYEWDLLAELNELLSFIIFILFVVIDLSVWYAAKDEDTAEGKMVSRLARESIWVVDVPCVVGIFFVMLLHHCLHRWMPQNEYFAHGLSAGAIAFHVAITQAAFAVLKTRDILATAPPSTLALLNPLPAGSSN